MSHAALDSFRQACGATGKLCLRIEHAAGAEERVLEEPFAVVGRDPRADIRLVDDQVSRRHVYLQVIAGGLYCVDLRSRTGVHWERGWATSGWLARNEAVRVGPFQIRLLDGVPEGPSPAGQGLDPLSSGSLKAGARPGVNFEFFAGPVSLMTWQMNRVLALLGRFPECKVHLNDMSVSGIHGSLVLTPEGVWVVDLFGRRGIVHNEEAVRFALLNVGDVLRVGKIGIRVLSQTPPGGSGRGGPTQQPASSPEWPAVAIEAPVTAPEGSHSLVASPDRLSSPSLPDLAGPVLLAPGQEAVALPAGVSDPDKLTEAVLLHLVRQFGTMQQQMFDQFQQTVVTLAHVFREIQTDQVRLIRQELEQVNRLTQELAALQAEAAQRSPGTVVQRLAPTVPKQVEAAPSEPRRLPAASKGKGPKQVATERMKAATGGGKVGRKNGVEATDLPPRKESSVTPPKKDEEIYAWLWQRMDAIQQERQGRWQKILSFFGGGASGGRIP